LQGCPLWFAQPRGREDERAPLKFFTCSSSSSGLCHSQPRSFIEQSNLASRHYHRRPPPRIALFTHRASYISNSIAMSDYGGDDDREPL
jgi:hypothetical protein